MPDCRLLHGMIAAMPFHVYCYILVYCSISKEHGSLAPDICIYFSIQTAYFRVRAAMTSSKTAKAQRRSKDLDAGTTINRIKRRKTEFRDKITSAALKLFARDGVADTSIASIIAAADIAHKTFFNHFPTKDHLLQHIMSTHTEHAYAFFQEALKRYSDPAKQLEYCLMQIAMALAPLDSQRYKELVTFYFVSSASTREFRDAQKQNFSALVTQILTNAKLKNRLKPEFNIEILNEMIVGICVATLLSWSVEEKYPIADKMKQAIKFINSSIFTETKEVEEKK